MKDEVERLLKAGFIRTAWYVEWLFNVVPVVKKNGKLRVCIDFKNLNLATPKDEYPMPVADQLVDAVAASDFCSLWMGIRDIIRSITLRKMFPKRNIGVQELLGLLNGWSCRLDLKMRGQLTKGQ